MSYQRPKEKRGNVATGLWRVQAETGSRRDRFPVFPQSPSVSTPHVPVERLAELARIALSEDERARFGAELDRVVAMMAELREAAVEGIEPLAHPFDAALRLREDAVTESDQADTFLEQAPESQGGYFLVPRVLA